MTTAQGSGGRDLAHILLLGVPIEFLDTIRRLTAGVEAEEYASGPNRA